MGAMLVPQDLVDVKVMTHPAGTRLCNLPFILDGVGKASACRRRVPETPQLQAGTRDGKWQRSGWDELDE